MLSKKFLDMRMILHVLIVQAVFLSELSAQPEPTKPPVRKFWRAGQSRDYPNPQTNYQGCERPASAWICDPNLQLDRTKIGEIDAKLNELYNPATPFFRKGCITPCGNSTSCSYTGLPVLITVMSSFSEDNHVAREKIMMEYANYFIENWRFDTCGDIIIFVIETGSQGRANPTVHRKRGDTFKKLISEDEEKRINKLVQPMFDSGAVADALLKTLTEYKNTLNENFATDVPPTSLSSNTVIISCVAVFVCIGFLIAGIMGVFYLYRRARRNREEAERTRLRDSGREDQNNEMTYRLENIAENAKNPTA